MNRSQMHRFVLASTLLLGLAAPALAQSLTQFQNGQVADASAVNANFQTVLGAAEAAQAVAGQAQSIASSVSGAVTNAQATADQAQATATSAATTATSAVAVANGVQNTFNTLANAMSFASGVIGNLVLGAFSNTGSLDRYLTIRTRGGNVARGGIKLRAGADDEGFTIENDERPASLGLNFLRHAADLAGQSALFISKSSGFVGIGTTAPTARLHVADGNIRFGPGGVYNPVAASESLRLVAGEVAQSGSIVRGAPAFSVQHTVSTNETGSYVITFAPPFAGSPSVTATVVESAARAQDNTILVANVTATGCEIRTYDLGYANFDVTSSRQDIGFTFIAVGPR